MIIEQNQTYRIFVDQHKFYKNNLEIDHAAAVAMAAVDMAASVVAPVSTTPEEVSVAVEEAD